jgi:hypothetical protein
MNTVISNAVFIISDLLLLVNLILISKSADLEEFKPGWIKSLSVSVVHGSYTLIFSSYFAESSKFMMTVLLAVYYLRFLVFPFIFTKKNKVYFILYAFAADILGFTHAKLCLMDI